MSDQPLRLLILGAHPDDAEYHAGGLASIYRRLGHAVKMVSVTDGGAGHHKHSSRQLVEIRRAEAAAAGAVIGAEYHTWDNPDGALMPTLAVRDQIIREIRTFQPDLVLTHRPWDYHPDHRAVGQAVQDACYLVTVPLVVPDCPIVKKAPVVAFMFDHFTRPIPFVPDVVRDITRQVDTIVAMLACHRTQMFEFLPFNGLAPTPVPADSRERRVWLRKWYTERIRPRATQCRTQLVATYGQRAGEQIQLAEAFEICQYGPPLDKATELKLFPLLT